MVVALRKHVFDKSWFNENQTRLLWWINTPVIKYVFRWIIGMNDKESYRKVQEIRPDSYVGEIGIFFKNKRYEKRIVIVNNKYPKYAKNLRNRLFYFWYLLHCWDLIVDSLAPQLSFGFDTLLDSYSETNQDDGDDITNGLANRNQWVGQSFTTPNDGNRYQITSCQWYIKKSPSQSPTGNIYSRLYDHSGTYGVSSIPASNTPLASSDVFDVSTLPTAYTLTSFSFTGANQYAMQINTHYIIEMDATGMTSGLANNARMGNDISAPTHGGNSNATDAANVTSTGAKATVDTIFYVYGTVYVAPATVKSNSNLLLLGVG